MAVAALAVASSGLLPLTPVAADEIYEMVFPVAGPNTYTDTWGAPRSGGRTHEGTDILADKMIPVVAVASGTVGWMHDVQGGNCCAMALNHDDGWASWYIHLNNDTPGTDDGLGWGFAPGIEQGVHVEAGQLIGWVGDSGNAEWTTSHLHFELHRPDGVKINPYQSLLVASDPLLIDSPIERLAGLDRYRTAIEVSQAAFPDGADTVFVATGENHPDSLAGIAAATHVNAPILLTNTGILNTYTKAELARLGPSEIVVLGGPAAVSESVEAELTAYAPTVTRLAGPTRFETAAAITEAVFAPDVPVLYVVDGLDFPEAVISGPMAGQQGGPVLLTRPDSIPSAVRNEITRLNPASIVVVSRDGVISDEVLIELTGYAPVAVVNGSDRYETAAELSATAVVPPTVVYVAVGNNYPDALTGGVLAAQESSAILLVETDFIPVAIQDELTRLTPERIVVLGGNGVVSTFVEAQLIGYLAEPAEEEPPPDEPPA